jgi:homoserine dehydrogenase
MGKQTIGVCMLGCGVVGTGVAHILHEQRELIAQRTGLNFELRHIVVRDAGKARPAYVAPVHDDARRAIEDPHTDVVVELIGGVDNRCNISDMRWN